MERKILVFTDKDLTGKEFLGFQVDICSEVPESTLSLMNSLENLTAEYMHILVDEVWYSKVKDKADALSLLMNSKTLSISLNVGHDETDRFYTDDLNYSDSEELNVGHLFATRNPSVTNKVELRFCVAIGNPHIIPYLAVADLLYSEGEDAMEFAITFNYSGCMEENNLECDSVFVKAGSLLKTYMTLTSNYPEEQFETVELYRHVKSDQYPMQSFESNDSHAFIIEMLRNAVLGK